MQKRLLDNPEAIELLVTSFYTRVRTDDLVAPIFNDAENFSWDTHIPVMISFWETLLLDTASYSGNAMAKHIALNRRTPLTPAHFIRWKQLFFEILDTLFEGPGVALAKKRVESMSSLMQFKIAESGKKGFIQ